MRSSMRLAVFLFVCFAASTAFSTYQNNSVASEHDKAIPSQMVDLSDESPPANNSLLNRRLKRDQPSWCTHLTNETAEQVIANCENVKGSGYVLRIQDINTTQIIFAKFYSLEVDVEIVGSSITDFILGTRLAVKSNKITISNNPKLTWITIFSAYINTSRIEIKDNPMLTTVYFNTTNDHDGGVFTGSLTMSNNAKLRSFQLLSDHMWVRDDGEEKRWLIENNPNLDTVDLKIKEGINTKGKFHIVNNKALTQLNLPDSMFMFSVSDIKISNNANLKMIKIPHAPGGFCIDKMEISHNPVLTTILLRNYYTNWIKTKLIIYDNPNLSRASLNAIQNIENNKRRQKYIDGLLGGTGREVTSFLLLIVVLA